MNSNSQLLRIRSLKALIDRLKDKTFGRLGCYAPLIGSQLV